MGGGQAFPGGTGELDAFGREGLLLTVFSGAFELIEATRIANALETLLWAAGKHSQMAYLGWAGTVAADSVSRCVYTR
jgi:hypothetical protein